jgi:molecular chaperone GrpE
MHLKDLSNVTLTKGCLVMLNESEQGKEIHSIEEKSVENSDSEELKIALAEEKSKCELNLTRWQRAQADFINYKRYAEQEKSDTCKFANTNLLLNILPVVDDFQRALNAVPHSEIKHKWLEGLKLVERKFQDALQKQGVEPINSVGEVFDPRFMEAITCGKGPKDIVLVELEKGYKLYDKVIRPAKVIVGTGEEELKGEESIKEE